MPKGEYTRKTAGLKAYAEITGEQLSPRVTLAEIKEYSLFLPPTKRKAYNELYRQYMSIGRPDYLEHYAERQQRKQTSKI